jgi:Iodothyronine deiodinase
MTRLQVGDLASDFELPRVDAERGTTMGSVRLADLVGRRPMVLAFGSYSCPMFQMLYPQVDGLARRYAESVGFLLVYGRERHPVGREVEWIKERGIVVEDHVDRDGRVRVASECAKSLQIRIPLLVDEMDDRVTAEYGGWPAAVRLIDTSGRLAYLSAEKGRVDVDELERAIRQELGFMKRPLSR